jgi:hypothetical protein
MAFQPFARQTPIAIAAAATPTAPPGTEVAYATVGATSGEVDLGDMP